MRACGSHRHRIRGQNIRVEGVAFDHGPQGQQLIFMGVAEQLCRYLGGAQREIHALHHEDNGDSERVRIILECID